MCRAISEPELILLLVILELNSINYDNKSPNHHEGSLHQLSPGAEIEKPPPPPPIIPPESLPIQLKRQLATESAIPHAATVTVVVIAQTLPHMIHASPVVFRALAMRSARFCFFSSSVNGRLYDIGSGD
jgi:hypothetical protein